MADFSIDQNNLPGVKEVCRDFAVLEDHCLAHNLQEQEIESHLASNVHKSRLVQQDLRVAKLLQEEEDKRAKAESKRHQQHIERFDNEMAQEIQEQLVRQAEQQRQQEEKDEAYARKMQEREMKEERKRHKQLEPNFEEQYFDDQASRSPLDPRHQHPGSVSPGYRKYQDYSRSRSPFDSPDPERKSYTSDSLAARNRFTEYEISESGLLRPPESPGRGRHQDYYSPERRPKHSEDRNAPLDLDYVEPRRRKKQDLTEQPRSARDEQETAVRRKDYSATREKDRSRDNNGQKTKERPKEKDHRARSRDRILSGDRVDERGRNLDREMDRNGHSSRDRLRERGRDKNRERHKSREREFDEYGLGPSRGWSEESLEWEDLKNRQRLQSGPNDVFEETNLRGVSNESPSSRERGRRMHGEYGMMEATHGLAHLDLQEQELRDMEVARRLQKEEIKASQIDKRAAQVAQDEELARRLMEEEKKEYKRSRDKEKYAMEKRRYDMEYKPVQEEVVRPRMRDEVYRREDEYQKAQNHKPARPPPPTQHYENLNPSYAYVESPYSPRPPSRPEAAYKGAYYRQ